MRDIEEDFRLSWKHMVAFYEAIIARDSDAKGVAAGMLPLVRRLATSDVAGRFRAGQTMTTLVISNSATHGLTPADPCVTVYFHPSGEYEIAFKPYGATAARQNRKAALHEVGAVVDAVLSKLANEAAR
jgi:hypothetical protein